MLSFPPQNDTYQIEIRVNPKQAQNPDIWKLRAAKKLGITPQKITDIRLIRQSIDARKSPVSVLLRLVISCGRKLDEYNLPPLEKSLPLPTTASPMLIIGAGPAGLFAGLEAIKQGKKPIILERGKDVSSRRFDLAPLMREGRVIEDSNYCFGEGGAGAFSDGKLYTRSTKRGDIHSIYATFVAHGAPPQILTDAHPHIGSNLLPKVVASMRQSILEAGGEVHFGAKVIDFLTDGRGRISGVLCADNREFLASRVLLATGHSARDIYSLFAKKGLLLEEKTFAVGVRIEHPQSLIDSIQYHLPKGKQRSSFLPAASYRLACRIKDRSVHSFCMCPGGFIVPAATENDEVVVNGMSLSRRDSAFANSGIVVEVTPEDTAFLKKEHGILAGIAYQKHLEVLTSQAGGGKQKAPAQRALDFLHSRTSDTLAPSSYFPGRTSVNLHEVLPHPITSRLQEGLQYFSKRMKGYISHEVGLIGSETRTSSPLRIPRDAQSLEHPEIEGLYPCGEGAGYAGGIVSAAIDGIRCARAACQSL